MVKLGKLTKVCVAIIALMIVFTSVQVEVRAQGELDPVVVLYDARHAPQFAAADEEDGLKLMLDMVNASTRYILKVHQGYPINETVLEDVDVLIVASPDSSSEFESEEVSAIKEMMTNGSSLLVLGDPAISQNSTYWNEQQFQDLGDNIALNRVLDSLNVTGVRFSINETSNDRYWQDTMFDYELALNETYPWVLRMDTNNWDTEHPIFRDINELLLMTATLKPLDAIGVLATGSESSFAQYRRGPNTFANFSFPNMSLAEFEEQPLAYSAINGTFPPWLSAFQYGNSRVIMSGSTIMFSGRTLDLPESDSRNEQQWFYSADNSRLFMNMLDWLSEGFVDPPSAIEPLIMISTGIFLVGVAYYVLKKIR
ncbi:hypothetical protein EU538_00800 [Candidatus Thorarchaeota archaeon]|nr:MAG: hypothetical protein EU538_00800 [Candidatus Thorarchaeota archaeon]